MAGAKSSLAPALGLLLLRLGAGGLLLYGHGWAKLMHYSQRAAHFPDPLGIGSPRSLMLVIFAEVLCSVMVMLGFATRFACVPLWKISSTSIIFLKLQKLNAVAANW